MIDRRTLISTGAAALAAAPLSLRADDRNPLSKAAHRNNRPDVETISAERAHQMAETGDAILIDVRPANAWPTMGTPELAEPLDFSDPMFWDILDVLTEGDKSMPIAVICWTGGRSLHVAEEMAMRGYRRPMDVGEGIKGSKDGPGWVAKGFGMNPYDGG